MLPRAELLKQVNDGYNKLVERLNCVVVNSPEVQFVGICKSETSLDAQKRFREKLSENGYEVPSILDISQDDVFKIKKQNAFVGYDINETIHKCTLWLVQRIEGHSGWYGSRLSPESYQKYQETHPEIYQQFLDRLESESTYIIVKLN